MLVQRSLIVASLIGLMAGCTVPEVQIGPQSGKNIEPAAGPKKSGPGQFSSDLDWPESRDCIGTLKTIELLHQEGKLAVMSTTAPIAMLIDDPTLSLIGDMPLPVTSQTQAAVYDCLIVIGEAQPAPIQPRQVIAERKLRSSYPFGTKQIPNPGYVKPENERNNKKSDRFIMNTGDPVIDIAGAIIDSVLFGMDSFFTEDENTLDTNLVNNSRYIEEDRLEPYSYYLAEIEASRSARIPVSLVDQRGGKGLETHLALRETQLFALSDDRHPKDRQIQHDPAARLITSLQLSRWESSPPSLSTTNLIKHLVAVSEGGRQVSELRKEDYQPRKLFGAGEAKTETVQHNFNSIEPAAGGTNIELIKTNKAPPLSINANRRQQFIRLGGKNAEAVAVPVSTDHLIAPIFTLPETALVPLFYPDGVKVYGLVENQNTDLGLALIYTPRSQEPGQFSDHFSDIGGRTHELSGEPKLQDDLIIGVWLDDPIAGWRFLGAPEIRKFANDRGVKIALSRTRKQPSSDQPSNNH